MKTMSKKNKVVISIININSKHVLISFRWAIRFSYLRH